MEINPKKCYVEDRKTGTVFKLRPKTCEVNFHVLTGDKIMCPMPDHKLKEEYKVFYCPSNCSKGCPVSSPT